MRIINIHTIMVVCLSAITLHVVWFRYANNSSIPACQSSSIEADEAPFTQLEMDSPNNLSFSSNLDYADISAYDYLKASIHSLTSKVIAIKIVAKDESFAGDIIYFQEITPTIGDEKLVIPFSRFFVPHYWFIENEVPLSTKIPVVLDSIKSITITQLPLHTTNDANILELTSIRLEKRFSIFPFIVLLAFIVYCIYVKTSKFPIRNESDQEEAVSDNEINYAEYKLIRKTIIEFYANELTIEAVANRTNIPYYRISTVIKENSGLTFKQYVNKVRIDIAKKKLGATELQVSEIAWDVGFKNVSHFNRVFKEVEKITPLEYRNASLTSNVNYMKKGGLSWNY